MRFTLGLKRSNTQDRYQIECMLDEFPIDLVIRLAHLTDTRIDNFALFFAGREVTFFESSLGELRFDRGCAVHFVSQSLQTKFLNSCGPMDQTWIQEEVVRLMAEHDLATEDNLAKIRDCCHLSRLHYAFLCLKNAHIFDQAMFARVIDHPRPHVFATIMEAYTLAHLTDEEALLATNEPTAIAFQKTAILNILNKAKIALPENLLAVNAHPHPHHIASTLAGLKQVGLLSADNREIVCALSYPYVFIPPLEILHTVGLANQVNFDLLREFNIYFQQKSFDLIKSLELIHAAQLLTQDNFNRLLDRVARVDMQGGLSVMHRAGILTQKNFNRLVEVVERPGLLRVLKTMSSIKILNEQNFLAIIAQSSPVLFMDVVDEFLWQRLAPHDITENFARILAIASEQNGLRRLREFTNQIFFNGAVVPELGRDLTLVQDRQNTHITSVHQSVSETAIRLKKRYGEHLDLEGHIAAIQARIASIDESCIQHQAAKRAISRLTDISNTYSDKYSQISIRELLALIYAAIQDESWCLNKESFAFKNLSYNEVRKILVQLEDDRLIVDKLKEVNESNFKNIQLTQEEIARIRALGVNLPLFTPLDERWQYLIDALYEIQRGYNIEDQDDFNIHDKSICTSGTFNKLIEKFQSVHPDFEIIILTKSQVSAKFTIVVRNVLIAYLKNLQEVNRTAYQEKINQLYQADNLEIIWDEIKEKVIQEIWAEFADLYYHSQMNPSFQELIASFIDLSLPKLEELDAKSLARPEVNWLSQSRLVATNKQLNLRQVCFFGTGLGTMIGLSVSGIALNTASVAFLGMFHALGLGLVVSYPILAVILVTALTAALSLALSALTYYALNHHH